MSIIIDGIDFEELPAEKYWSWPSTYKGDKIAETTNMIIGGEYIGARKMDGAYFRFIKGMDGTIRLQSRSESVKGGYLDKYEWVPQIHDWAKTIPNGTCLLGELYFPKNEGSRHVTTITGCLLDKALERQEKGEKLHYYVFDIWAWDGESFLKTTAEVRFSILGGISCNSTFSNKYVEYAQYFYGPTLWDEFIKIRNQGGEGIVITQANSIPAPGKRTARKTLKVKKELDNPIDCFLTGGWRPATRLYTGDYIGSWPYWENTYTGEKMQGQFYFDYTQGATIEPVTKAYFYGWASAVELGVVESCDGQATFMGETVPGVNIRSIGWVSGITEEVRAGIVNENEKWKGRVVKVNAMEVEPDTLRLRHGKIIEWRAPGDKSWKECNIDQLL